MIQCRGAVGRTMNATTVYVAQPPATSHIPSSSNRHFLDRSAPWWELHKASDPPSVKKVPMAASAHGGDAGMTTDTPVSRKEEKKSATPEMVQPMSIAVVKGDGFT